MRGPLLAAANFAIAWDRANPDRAGQYPPFWAERIERARAAGFPADDEKADRDYWRAYEDAPTYTPSAPAASTTQPHLPSTGGTAEELLGGDDPFADTPEDMARRAQIDIDRWMEGVER